MPKIIHDLCGIAVERSTLQSHRLKCYVPGIAHGFIGTIDKDGMPTENPKGTYCEVKDGKASVVTRNPQPEAVIATEE